MGKTLYMETTEISPEKTAADVTSLLVRAGAHQLMMEYDDKREISGLRFAFKMKDGRVWICVLPARVEPIFNILNGRRRNSWDRTQKRQSDMEQAKRVAWRQLLRWTEAQLAMIDAGMVQAAEVFLPYVEVEPGVTMFQKLITDPNRMIEAPKEEPAVITAEFA